MLAEADIRAPAGQLRAACDKKYRHPNLAFRPRNKPGWASVTTPLPPRSIPPLVNPARKRSRSMPMLLGSTTLACTLFSMMLGQVAFGMESLGVLLASL